MVKKITGKVSDTKVHKGVVDFAYDIWLAGLGAFVLAEQEGSRLFKVLVQEGEAFEARSKQEAENRIEQAADQIKEAKGKVQEVRETAIDNWDKLEQVFQERVAWALNRLGVPSHEDIRDLASKVEALQESINKLSAQD